MGSGRGGNEILASVGSVSAVEVNGCLSKFFASYMSTREYLFSATAKTIPVVSYVTTGEEGRFRRPCSSDERAHLW